MKKHRIILESFLAIAALGLFGACSKSFQEVTDLVLTRCLQPMNVSAKISQGQNVTFSWDVTKDAESYTLEVYTDKDLKTLSFKEELSTIEVPYTKYLEVDQEFWFRVKAQCEGLEDSKWANYSGSIKTYAVKGNLYPKVTDRTANSVSFKWNVDKEVDRIEYKAVGAETSAKYTLTNEDIAAGTATVTGLTASTEYDFILYFSSANRGQLDAWTLPDASKLTVVENTAALLQAIKDGASALVKISGSPYTIGEADLEKGLDVSKGFKLYGEGDAEGNRPVIYGTVSLADDFDGGDIYFEGIEFNGKESKCGFAIQKKNGGSASDLAVKSIVYKNCAITSYSKGLFYEWGKTLKIGEFTYESCEIHDVNADGTVGGDGFDLRNATSIDKLNLTGNTIYNGFRTFLRIDATPVIGDVVFENNTIMNICFVDNTNNGGVIAFQVAPKSFSFKNNLFLNMGDKSTLTSANTKYIAGDKLGLAAGNNWFYNVNESFFTDNFTLAMASGKTLSADPCFNAKGGRFNILSDSEIAGKKVGAPKWWSAYVEEPEDLTLNVLEGSHTWDFTNAKFFSGDVTKAKVRDQLLMNVVSNKITISDKGVFGFTSAATTSKKGVPTDGYLAFKVNTSGSVVIRPEDEAGLGHHFVIGTGSEGGESISVKGGAAALTDMAGTQKITILGIEKECLIYIYPTGAISLRSLAWSTDTSAVNTALPSPVPTATPATITAGEAKDVVVSWEPVENAGSYSVVFNKKEYPLDETTEGGNLSCTISQTTIGMLDAGVYTVNVYANPAKNDIYNTMSVAGTAAFAIQPKSQGGGETELVVNTVDELKSAVAAGKSEITLAANEFDLSADAELSGTLPVAAPLALKGKDGALVKGALSLSGEVGEVSVENITFQDCGKGCLVTLLETPELKATSLSITGCTLDGYSKSIIYGNFATSVIDKISIIGNTIQNQGTGQGVFDFRKGTYAQIGIVGNTIIGGRDFIRMDAACKTSSVDISNNTFDGVTLDNGNGVLYVRADVSKYTVNRNLFLNEVKTAGKTFLSKATGVKVPTNMSGNYYYNIDETSFLKGMIDSTTATFKGAILAASPVKDLANHDYTLTNGVVIASKAGAFKWQPSATYCDQEKITVNNAEEFKNALDAGKVEIILAAAGSPYTFSESSSFEIPANLHIVGESGSLPEFHGCFTMSGTEDLGTVIFDNIKFCGDGTLGCVFTASGTPTARNITVKNCTVDGFTKSVYYGSAAATLQALVFSGVKVQNHGTGQGVFDIRKGACSSLTISNCTITGGRDLIRADAGTITDCFNFTNNTVYGSNVGVNSNGIMYVRATPTVYKFTNNLFLSEKADGKTVILGKATGVTVPTEAGKNFVWNYDETNFFTAPFTQEATGFSPLSYCPVKDAANGDYTLTDALCLSSNIGALSWNTNRGRVTSEITVTSLEEFINALAAGKTAVTVKADTLDFTAAPAEATSFSGGVLSLSSSLTIAGTKTLGKDPVIKGGFKLNTGVESFIAQSLVFDGKDKAIGNFIEVGGALETSKIIVRGCEIMQYNKSLFYGSIEGSVGSASFSGLLVHDMGTGQGMFDCRKKVYGSIVIENSTIYNGGRDLVRCDSGVGQSLCVRNNTLSNTGIGAGNGLLWVRIDVGDQYVVENNLFLNETGTTMLAKSGAKKAVFKNNHYFNLGESFWTGTYTQEEGIAGGGSILDADPCTNSADGQFKLTNQNLKTLGVGDSRWR